jgi:uncharacterized protein (DUF58 family)
VLTRSGLGVILAALVVGGLGWWWNYEELVVGALGVGGLVVLAIWASHRPLRATITRTVTTIRVPRGDSIRVSYRLQNTTRFRSGRATIVDSCDNQVARTQINPLQPETVVQVYGQIPTRRRGLFEVGPFGVERIDPFWLSVGTRFETTSSLVTVHPKIYRLIGPQGAARVVESESIVRRATIDPMSGFISMREYVPGDDPRMIHWPTTARTGTLMIREHVEVRRPEYTVILDTARAVGTPDDFEEAVDVAASLAVHAIRSGLDVVVRTTSRRDPGRSRALVEEAMVLDLLTPVQQTTGTDLLPVASLFVSGFDQTSVVMVTGPSGPSSLFTTSDRMSVVRVGRGAVGGGGAMGAADAREFVSRWRAWD